MRLSQCHNFRDFRELARRRLPAPIFNYTDGGAEDETAYRRNTAAFDAVDLLPHVLRGTEEIDLSTEVLGLKLDLPFLLAPTASQRLFHHQGERTAAAAAPTCSTSPPPARKVSSGCSACSRRKWPAICG